MSSPAKLPRLWALASVAVSFFLFVIACALPVLTFVDPGEKAWSGVSVLMIGVMGIFIGQVGWFANPLLALAWLACLLRWWIASAVIAGLGLLVALTSFLIVGADIPMDEAGVHRATVSFLHVGFYVWILAFLAALAGPIVLRVVASMRSSPAPRQGP